MEIRFKIKPIIFQSPTYRGVFKDLLDHYGPVLHVDPGKCMVNSLNGDRIVFNLQKQRRKTSQLRVYDCHHENENYAEHYTSSDIIREKGWTAYVYEIPEDVPVEVYQSWRNFSIKEV